MPRRASVRVPALTLLTALALMPVVSRAETPPLDLFLGLGGSGVSAIVDGDAELSGRFLIDGGAALGFVGSTTALAGAARLALGGPDPEVGAWLGVRSHFGRDAFTTWVDVDLALRFTPAFDLGPRAALGARWEFAPALATYASAGIQLGFLQGLRGDLELSVGLMGLFSLGG